MLHTGQEKNLEMGKKKDKNQRRTIVEAIHRNALTTGHTDSMIRRITVRDVATYGHEGVTLDDLQRVNYIYGGNGSGKTTLSRLLASSGVQDSQDSQARMSDQRSSAGFKVQGSTKNQFQNCEVEWTEMPLKVLVYNRDFRKRNLMENIPGVFTLGEESVEAEKKMEELQKELEMENMNLTSKQKRIEAREKQIRQDTARLRDMLWNEVLQPQYEYFEECLDDEVTSKAQFAKQMTAMVENGKYKQALGREGLQTRYRTLYRGERLVKVDEMRTPEEAFETLGEVETDEIWQTPLIAKGEGEIEACMKCEKRPVPEEYLKGLADYFDSDYKKDMERLRKLAQKYEENMQQMKETLYGQMSLLAAHVSRFTVNGREGKMGSHVQVMRMMVEMLKDRMDTNYRIMVNKLENPTMVAQFKDIKGTVGSLWQIIAETNTEIREYNQMVENLKPERERLKDDLLTYLAGRSAGTVKYWQQAVAQKRADLQVLHLEADKIVKKTNELNEQIREQKKKLASTKPTVERINNELKRYDFTGFSIQPTKKGNSYQIQRDDGSFVQDTLSEGETMFITFLYYLQLVKGGETNSQVREKKVLVIDDPISSLDDKVMGAVSTMVRQLIESVNGVYGENAVESDINQIFVLTHNTDFYKKVTWVNPRNMKRRGCHHWVLDKYRNETRVDAYGMKNPVKMGYDQTWADLKEGLEEGRSIHGEMRKIIETYFVEYGGYEKNKLIPVYFADDEVERTKMTALMEWIDTGVHKGEEARNAGAPVVVNRRRLEEFRRLFEKAGQLGHYEMMMREKDERTSRQKKEESPAENGREVQGETRR